MKKIKKFIIISIIIAFFAIILNLLAYMETKDSGEEVEAFLYLSNIASSLIIIVMYIYFLCLKEQKYKGQKWWFITMVILTMFASLLVVIINFFTLDAILSYVYKPRTIEKVYVTPKRNEDGSLDTVAMRAETMAKEFKQMQELKKNNAISNEEYEHYKEEFCKKIGISSTDIEDIDV